MSESPTPTFPDKAEAPSVTDLGFMEARACLINIAAYLDRAERYGEGGDFRNGELRSALKFVADGGSGATLAARLLESFSDKSADPLEQTPPYPVVGVVTPQTEEDEQ